MVVGECVTGLNREWVALILAAIAHAGSSAGKGFRINPETGQPEWHDYPLLYPCPDPA